MKKDIVLTVSVVSHRQIALVRMLLDDIDRCSDIQLEVILTINVSEELNFDSRKYGFSVKIIKNDEPKGFGENHNFAFKMSHTKYFCVINPDISIREDVFLKLLKCFKSPNIALTAPFVVNEKNEIEDSVRQHITPIRIIRRMFNNINANVSLSSPDWVAGMFMLFDSEVFKKINGFDEGFFMYCEDADICLRLSEAGYSIFVDDSTRVIHKARRDSHRKLKYVYWHVKSLMRYFLKHPFYKL